MATVMHNDFWLNKKKHLNFKAWQISVLKYRTNIWKYLKCLHVNEINVFLYFKDNRSTKIPIWK